jgi:hypothetical protein
VFVLSNFVLVCGFFPLHCLSFSIFLAAMGKMYKKKQHEKHGPRKDHTNKLDDEMDIRKIMKDVENFSMFCFFRLYFLLNGVYLLIESAVCFCCT